MTTETAHTPVLDAPATWQSLHALDQIQAVGAFRTMQAINVGASLASDANRVALEAVVAHNRTLMATLAAQSETIRTLQNENARLRGQLVGRPVIVQEVERAAPEHEPDEAATGIGKIIGDVATAAVRQLGSNLLEDQS